MNKEDKELQKQLVDEMMKVSKTNPDVIIYMQALMESYEKLKQELDQYKNNWEELKKELKTAYSELFEHELINGREFIENILNEMKELEEDK